ncbi:hypothetical protein GJ496_008226 [Pomphorhynchus laevis]|nr:hypothetical protein GJ496_008226 [Pomphorhynchus laevis]
MTEDDDALRRSNFQGSLPISIMLGTSDQVAFTNSVVPLFLQLPRFCYLMMYTDKIFRHFENSMCSRSDKQKIWFSNQLVDDPIQHQYPIGLLYDLHHNVSSSNPLWQITVHFQDFPYEELAQHNTPDLVELSYMYAVKEADAITHNSLEIQNMSKKDHKNLWSGLYESDYDKFYSVFSRLQKSPVMNIPFRVHKLNKSIIQRCIPAYRHVTVDDNEEIQENCVADMLKICNISSSDYSLILLNGIMINSKSSLIWLFQHLAFADNFLHFALIQ